MDRLQEGNSPHFLRKHVMGEDYSLNVGLSHVSVRQFAEVPLTIPQYDMTEETRPTCRQMRQRKEEIRNWVTVRLHLGSSFPRCQDEGSWILLLCLAGSFTQDERVAVASGPPSFVSIDCIPWMSGVRDQVQVALIGSRSMRVAPAGHARPCIGTSRHVFHTKRYAGPTPRC